jgi:hypothetical protein
MSTETKTSNVGSPKEIVASPSLVKRRPSVTSASPEKKSQNQVTDSVIPEPTSLRRLSMSSSTEKPIESPTTSIVVAPPASTVKKRPSVAMTSTENKSSVSNTEPQSIPIPVPTKTVRRPSVVNPTNSGSKTQSEQSMTQSPELVPIPVPTKTVRRPSVVNPTNSGSKTQSEQSITQSPELVSIPVPTKTVRRPSVTSAQSTSTVSTTDPNPAKKKTGFFSSLTSSSTSPREMTASNSDVSSTIKDSSASTSPRSRRPSILSVFSFSSGKPKSGTEDSTGPIDKSNKVLETEAVTVEKKVEEILYYNIKEENKQKPPVITISPTATSTSSSVGVSPDKSTSDQPRFFQFLSRLKTEGSNSSASDKDRHRLSSGSSPRVSQPLITPRNRGSEGSSGATSGGTTSSGGTSGSVRRTRDVIQAQVEELRELETVEKTVQKLKAQKPPSPRSKYSL